MHKKWCAQTNRQNKHRTHETQSRHWKLLCPLAVKKQNARKTNMHLRKPFAPCPIITNIAQKSLAMKTTLSSIGPGTAPKTRTHTPPFADFATKFRTRIWHNQRKHQEQRKHENDNHTIANTPTKRPMSCARKTDRKDQMIAMPHSSTIHHPGPSSTEKCNTKAQQQRSIIMSPT